MIQTKINIISSRLLFRVPVAVGAIIFSLLAVLLVEPELAQGIVRYGGYFITLVASGAFAVYFVLSVRSLACPGGCRGRMIACSLSVLLGSLLLFAHADFGYKMAMDDYILVATAKSMHENKEVAVTQVGSFFGNTFKRDAVQVDKRQWFYPFVVSSLHDLIGYRSANPFVVNALAAVLFLGGVYLFGYLLAGQMAGVLSVLLWATLPLLAQNATGAGMEMLNLLMLQIVALLAVLYLRKPSSSLEGALSLAAVLLTYTRYESGLFLIPVGVVIVLGWWRERRVLLSWGSVCAAPLLLGVVLQTSIYVATESSWEMMRGANSPFSIGNLLANFPHALNFFFSGDDTLANSLLLSVLGFPALVAFLVLARRELTSYWGKNPAGVITLLFGLFLLLHLGVVISFHAGQLDRPFVSRYALPFHWILVFSLIAVLGNAAVWWPQVWRAFITVALVFILSFTLPMNTKAIFSKTNFRVRELNWLEAMSDLRFKPRSLIIDRVTIPWALREWVAIEPQVALLNVDGITRDVVSRKYPEVFLVERMHYDRGEFVADFPAIVDLQKVFKMELVRERSFRPFELTRLYRLTGYRPPN